MVYVADLAPVLAEASRVLAAGGLLAFTAETHDGEGVIIGEGLRYAHGAAYVRAAVEAAGLKLSPAGRSLRPQRGQRAGAGPGRGRRENLSLDATRMRRYGGIASRHVVLLPADAGMPDQGSASREKQQ